MAECLYRHKSSQIYYGLVKRSGKHNFAACSKLMIGDSLKEPQSCLRSSAFSLFLRDKRV
jgi:hypothetical protein